MANLSINFVITTVREQNQDPFYRVAVTTGVVGSSAPSFVDGNLLLIERKQTLDGPLDVFYGIVKAVDFQYFRKAEPNDTQNMYRSNSWNLVFYSQKTMDEAIALMNAQIDILSEDIAIVNKTNNRRSVTHMSPSF